MESHRKGPVEIAGVVNSLRAHLPHRRKAPSSPEVTCGSGTWVLLMAGELILHIYSMKKNLMEEEENYNLLEIVLFAITDWFGSLFELWLNLKNSDSCHGCSLSFN